MSYDPKLYGHLVTCHSCGELHMSDWFCDCYVQLLRQIFDRRDQRKREAKERKLKMIQAALCK